MNAIKSLRQIIGLTQMELAVYLECSVSMIRMVETNKRTLPTKALLKMSELQLLMEALPKNSATEASMLVTKKATAAFLKTMELRIKEIDYQILLQQKKLEQIEKLQKHATHALALLSALKANKSKKNTAIEIAVFKAIELAAHKKIKNAHPLLQSHFDIKIALLQQEKTCIAAITNSLQ